MLDSNYISLDYMIDIGDIYDESVNYLYYWKQDEKVFVGWKRK